MHERDVLIPLGLTPVEEPDEVVACLGYAASLSAAFAVAGGSTRRGCVDIESTDPDCRLVVELPDATAVPGR